MADPGDRAALASDIRALSALLDIAKHYWWPPASRTGGVDIKSFSHISTLLGLATGVPVATTGIITAEAITATIVCVRRAEAQQLPDQDVAKTHSVKRSTRSLNEVLQR